MDDSYIVPLFSRAIRKVCYKGTAYKLGRERRKIRMLTYHQLTNTKNASPELVGRGIHAYLFGHFNSLYQIDGNKNL